MRQLIVAVLFLGTSFCASKAVASCSPSTATVGPHNGARVEVMCRGETACYSNPCYGRCGPGCNWSVLGNYYTSACTNHDSCIETRMCSYGDSSNAAQANCVGLLPAAIASEANSAWYNGVSWVSDAVTGVWTHIRSLF
jgi:hypothetical protein